MSDPNWRWTVVAVNAAIFLALVAAFMYWEGGGVELPTFATISALLLLGVFFRWRRRNKLS
jgi:hypothetical protein